MPSRLKRGQTLELTPEEVGAVLTGGGNASRGSGAAEPGAGRQDQRAGRSPAGHGAARAGTRSARPRRPRARQPGAGAGRRATRRRADAGAEFEGIEPGNSVHGQPTHGNTPVGKFFSKSHGKPHGRPQGQGGPRRGGPGMPDRDMAAARTASPGARSTASRATASRDAGHAPSSPYVMTTLTVPGARTRGPARDRWPAIPRARRGAGGPRGQNAGNAFRGPGAGQGKKRGRGNRNRRGPNAEPMPGNDAPRAPEPGDHRRRHRQPLGAAGRAFTYATAAERGAARPGGQSGPNCGGRLARNAVMPSAKSAVAAQAPNETASACSCSDSVRAIDSRTRRLVLRSADDGPGNQRLNDRVGRGVELGRRDDLVDDTERERLGGAEALAEQQDLHRLAHADEARQRPRAAAVRATARSAGTRTRNTHRRTRRRGRRRSSATARSRPPHRECGRRPGAASGAGSRSPRADARPSGRKIAWRSAGGRPSSAANRRMSPPAMKCLPAPRSTTTRRLSSAASAAVCATSASIIAKSSTLSASGRFSVSVATGPSRSRRTVSFIGKKSSTRA